MKILLAHRYFWPDTPPYATMLREIAARLAQDGHDVRVFSTQPSYKDDISIESRPARETIDGFDVVRCRLLPESKRNWLARSVNSLVFLAQFVFFAVVRKRPDVIMISTMPPVFAGIAGLMAARLAGARFFYHCQDIHPEAAQLGAVRLIGSGSGFRLLRFLDRFTVSRADRVIVLSRDMSNTIAQRDRATGNIEVINNFALPGQPPQRPDDSGFRKQADKFRVIFAGNIGGYQGLDAVIEAAKLLADDPAIEFVFMGEGAARQHLRSVAGPLADVSVRFIPHQPLEVARFLMGESDLGLVTLKSGIYRVAYPSKTMTYLMEGCPILAMVENDSELARFIAAQGVGEVVAPGDAKALAGVVRSLRLDPARAGKLKSRAATVGRETFSPDVVLDRWTALFGGEAI